MFPEREWFVWQSWKSLRIRFRPWAFQSCKQQKTSKLRLSVSSMPKISYRFCSIALSFITALSLVLQKLFFSLIGRIYPASKHGSSFQPIRGIFSCSERIFANEIVGRKKEQMNRSICFKQ